MTKTHEPLAGACRQTVVARLNNATQIAAFRHPIWSCHGSADEDRWKPDPVASRREGLVAGTPGERRRTKLAHRAAGRVREHRLERNTPGHRGRARGTGRQPDA